MTEDSKDLLPIVQPQRWEKRFTIEAQRVSEAVRLYRSLGFEVRVEKVIDDQTLTCTECFTDADELVLISTRPLSDKEPQ